MEETGVAVQCRHHWVIDSPDGPTSHGVCKNCGEEKTFSNIVADTVWENESYTEVFARYWGKRKRRSVREEQEEEYLPQAS